MEVTRGYVRNVVRGRGRPEGDPFRVVYISGEGADPSGKSFILSSRIKHGAGQRQNWLRPAAPRQV